MVHCVKLYWLIKAYKTLFLGTYALYVQLYLKQFELIQVFNVIVTQVPIVKLMIDI